MWRVKSQFEKLLAKATEDSDFYYQFKKMNENPRIDSGMQFSFSFLLRNQQSKVKSTSNDIIADKQKMVCKLSLLLRLYMSPVSLVFHTIVTVKLISKMYLKKNTPILFYSLIYITTHSPY